jgi:hypothetical protein
MPEQLPPHLRPPAGGQTPEGRSPKYDRLVVRRDAHRELTYRYDREERLARRTAPRRPSGAASFLRNRTSRMLLLNVVLLAVIAIAAIRLLSASADHARIGPFEASLQSALIDDTVYVAVTLRFAGRAGAEASTERFTARLALEPGGEAVMKGAALPRSPGEEVTVGEALPLAGATRARADLQFGNRKQTLIRELGR